MWCCKYPASESSVELLGFAEFSFSSVAQSYCIDGWETHTACSLQPPSRELCAAEVRPRLSLKCVHFECMLFQGRTMSNNAVSHKDTQSHRNAVLFSWVLYCFFEWVCAPECFNGSPMWKHVVQKGRVWFRHMICLDIFISLWSVWVACPGCSSYCGAFDLYWDWLFFLNLN